MVASLGLSGNEPVLNISAGKCCVRDCCDAGDVSVAVADAVGPAGRRCWRHAVERLEEYHTSTPCKTPHANPNI
eukprot:3233468-Amphidinium_carterae.1